MPTVKLPPREIKSTALLQGHLQKQGFAVLGVALNATGVYVNLSPSEGKDVSQAVAGYVNPDYLEISCDAPLSAFRGDDGPRYRAPAGSSLLFTIRKRSGVDGTAKTGVEMVDVHWHGSPAPKSVNQVVLVNGVGQVTVGPFKKAGGCVEAVPVGELLVDVPPVLRGSAYVDVF